MACCCKFCSNTLGNMSVSILGNTLGNMWEIRSRYVKPDTDISESRVMHPLVKQLNLSGEASTKRSAFSNSLLR